MKITIITLYRAALCEHYTKAVEGSLTDEEKIKIAKEWSLSDDEDEADEISFCEVEVGEESMPNIGKDGTISGNNPEAIYRS